jgi:DNA polymerase III epsilon subunit-like protein
MEFVFLDTETGGLGPADPIIQIGAIAVDASTWTETEAFERKLQFDEQRCALEALRVNHYDRALWEREAVPARGGFVMLKAFLDRHAKVQLVSTRSGKAYSVARIGGHNVQFDVERLRLNFKNADLFFPAQLANVLDTMHGAAWLTATAPFPPKDLKLTTLAEYFHVAEPEGAHDALADARTCARIARVLIERIEE